MNGRDLELAAQRRSDEVQVYFQCYDDTEWEGTQTASFATAKAEQRERQKAGRSTRIVTSFFDGDGEVITKAQAEAILGAAPKAAPTAPKALRIAQPATPVNDGLLVRIPVEVVEPVVVRAKSYVVCGYCTAAPRYRDSVEAHLLCSHDWCQCSLLNHRPDAKVRDVQAKSNSLSVAQVEALDSGLVRVSA